MFSDYLTASQDSIDSPARPDNPLSRSPSPSLPSPSSTPQHVSQLLDISIPIHHQSGPSSPSPGPHPGYWVSPSPSGVDWRNRCQLLTWMMLRQWGFNLVSYILLYLSGYWIIDKIKTSHQLRNCMRHVTDYNCTNILGSLPWFYAMQQLLDTSLAQAQSAGYS